jgi:hypothetical protein
MYPKTLAVQSAALTTLVIAAGAVLVSDYLSAGRREETTKEFQHLVGGLGFGPAVDLSRCAFSFDPRLCTSCQENLGPIPGGVFFCPHHACSILYYLPLDRMREALGGTGQDALLP